MSKLSDWNLIKLDKRFGLEEVATLPSLEHLTNSDQMLTTTEESFLLLLQESLIVNIDNWNEQELSMHFIGPVFSLLKFTNRKYNLFAERILYGIVDGEEISGLPDCIIAKGFREPEIPYFCLHEYKRESDPNGDPAGQCLAGMLVAQGLNAPDTPLYGCYVKGRVWFFMALEGHQYSITEVGYNSCSKELLTIFLILKNLKSIIEKQL
jgi:hypothetical protein